MVLDGRPCVVIETSSSGSTQAVETLTGEYWIDVERDYSVLRYTEKFSGATTLELNIRYRVEEFAGVVPYEWDATFANGNYACRCELISFQPNPMVSNEDFKLSFPAGTVVFDRDQGIRALRKSDGTQRIITAAESAVGFTLDELQNSNSGSLAHQQFAWDHQGGWIFLTGSFILFIAFGLIWANRHRKSVVR
jgi:hypothetical protein